MLLYCIVFSIKKEIKIKISLSMDTVFISKKTMNYKTSFFVIFTAIAGCGRDPSVTARLAWKNTENVRAWQIILIPFNMQDKLIVVGIAKSGTLSPTPVISAAAYQTFFAAICPGTAANRTQNHAVVPTCFSFFLASVIFDVKLYR